MNNFFFFFLLPNGMIEKRQELTDAQYHLAQPMFISEAKWPLPHPPGTLSPQMEPWSSSLTPPNPPLLQPPVAVVFEAKWGVNKSNIGGIVRHPEGPSEVTPEVQITSGHILLVFLFAALFPWRLQLRRGAHRRLRPSLFTFARLTWWNAQLYCLGGGGSRGPAGLVKVKTRDHHAERQMPMQQFCLGKKMQKKKIKLYFFRKKS